jgi:hypothetical protein
MNQWIGVLGAAALIVGFVFLLRRSAADSGEPRERELHRLCRGDRKMMERLISHEQEKHQGRNREAAVRAAIDSIKRDNR